MTKGTIQGENAVGRFARPPGRPGFTLIELSIVLVIIGLLVGGILVGRDMIEASEIRATIRQVEEFDSAANTFKAKYGYLPGDIPLQQSSAFGFFTMDAWRGGQRGFQDGNGLIEGLGGAGSPGPLGEPLIFWRHLSDAGLVAGQYGSAGSGKIDPVTGEILGSDISQSLPASKLAPNNYFTVYSYMGTNYYQLGPWARVHIAFFEGNPGANGLTPIDSLAIDAKIDDGLPNTGRVVALGATGAGGMHMLTPNAAPSWQSSPTSATCLMGGSGAGATDPADEYNTVSGSGGDDGSCSLRFQFQ